MATKTKTKKTVRGPQLELLKAKPVKPGTRAAGKEPPRTMRMRFIEPPTKKDGNPFFALRVPPALLRSFKAYAKKENKATTALVREYMAAVTGFELEVADAE